MKARNLNWIEDQMSFDYPYLYRLMHEDVQFALRISFLRITNHGSAWKGINCKLETRKKPITEKYKL